MTHVVTVIIELILFAWVLGLLRQEYKRWRALLRRWYRHDAVVPGPDAQRKPCVRAREEGRL